MWLRHQIGDGVALTVHRRELRNHGAQPVTIRQDARALGVSDPVCSAPGVAWTDDPPSITRSRVRQV